MSGSTITLKNVPPELHRSLKELAKKHKRSLNQEVIVCLEGILRQPGGPRVSLANPPRPSDAGKMLIPLGDRAEREDEFLKREA